MIAEERIKLLDKLTDHYFFHKLNIYDSSKNQLSIYLGFENKINIRQKPLLSDELLSHPLYEPILGEMGDFKDEVEFLDFEHKQYLKKFDRDKEKAIEDYGLLKNEIRRYTEAIKKAKQQQEEIWVTKKSLIQEYIFDHKMSENDAHANQIKAVFHTGFYEEIDSFPLEENIKAMLAAYDKVMPIYKELFQENETCKPLRDLVRVIEKEETIDVSQYNFYADTNSISDFFYLWNLKSTKENEALGLNYKIGYTNNLLYGFSEEGWSDTVIIKESENNILVDEEILVFDSQEINPNYLLLTLNLTVYRDLGYYYYHTQNNLNAVLDFLIPIPPIEVQDYFSEAIETYFNLTRKYMELQEIRVEAWNILKKEGEAATHYFLDRKIYNK